MPYLGTTPSQTSVAVDYQDLTGVTGNPAKRGFTLDNGVTNANEIEVFVNNVRQKPGVAYTVSGTTLTMTGDVETTDDFYVVFQGKAVGTVGPPDGSVTSAKLVYPLTTFSSTGIDDNATSTAMTLDSSGNVGINTTSPSSKLDITNSYSTDNNTSLTLTNSNGSAGDNGAISYRTYTGSGYVTSAQINSAPGSGFNASYLKFRVADSSQNLQERMRIDSSGNLLVGATTFDIVGNNATGFTMAGAGEAQISRDGAVALKLHRKTNTGSMLEFFYNGPTIVGSITTNGSSVSYNTSSDYRLKENVTDITGATERLKQLNPVRFNFISDADTTVDGFLAHEVQTVVPEAITGTHNEVDDDGNPVYQGIDQSKLVPLLVATIQELEARIAALEAN